MSLSFVYKSGCCHYCFIRTTHFSLRCLGRRSAFTTLFTSPLCQCAHLYLIGTPLHLCIRNLVPAAHLLWNRTASCIMPHHINCVYSVRFCYPFRIFTTNPAAAAASSTTPIGRSPLPSPGCTVPGQQAGGNMYLGNFNQQKNARSPNGTSANDKK